MNPRIQKLRDERTKNREKIARLEKRNEELNKKITELENLDIIDMVRTVNVSPEELNALLEKIKSGPIKEQNDE